jgi:putative peptidoglycan lipid II flippase
LSEYLLALFPVTDSTKPPAKSLVSIAKVVAIATILSKFAGLIRQVLINSAFGLSIVATAFSYSYVIPSFFFILLGGINGPFHSAVTSVLARQKDRKKISAIVEAVNTIVAIVLIIAAVLMIIFAHNIIDAFTNGLADGLKADLQKKGLSGAALEQMVSKMAVATRNVAIEQLQIMSFMVVLSGLIGIGFGTLNAGDMYWLPSISPLLSSLTTIGGLAWLLWYLPGTTGSLENALLGGRILAWTTLAGAVLQWLVQVFAQWKAGLGTLRPRFNFQQQEVKEVLGIMLPAILSTSMLTVNLVTDLSFAAKIDGAAPAFASANLLVQTPLGIVSNLILQPLMPIFSRLAEPKNWPELKDRIRQGLILAGVTMMPLGAVMIALSLPLIQTAFQRGAFTQSNSEFLSSILIVSASGMFFFLARDVLVRVFYALGDGKTPFRIGIVNIGVNLGLDYLLYKPLGAPGITLATVGVNLFTLVIFLGILNQRLRGLPWRDLAYPLFGVFGASSIAGSAAWAIVIGWQKYFPSTYAGADGKILVNLFSTIGQLVVAGGIGLGLFALISTQIGVPEVDILVSRLRQKLRKK